ncbi:ATP-binding protein [Microbacterium sp. NPDC096154]|uniref:sensor histidine kinase n=1 Tax=Microbacterium sp. NPDC096154 TaxID=3155549 RepID=UPI003322F1CD
MVSSDARGAGGQVAGGQGAGGQGAEFATGGVVRVLCTVRLLVLVLGSVDALLTRDPSVAIVALCAAPFSFVPALNWRTRGPRYFRNGILLSADLLVTAFVLLMLSGTSLMAAYGAATVALWGSASGLRIALLMSVPVVLLLVPWAQLGAGWRGPLLGMVAAGSVVGMAWAGHSLGVSLRRERHTALELAAEREQRAATRERLRIARDLHDTVAGDLAGIALLVRGLAGQCANGAVPASTAGLVQQLDAAAQTAHEHTRLALRQLRRASVDLPTELREIAARWRDRVGVDVEFEVDDSLGAVDDELAADVASVLQELLENVRKHAAAERVRVECSSSGGHVRLVVEDDGSGMAARPDDDGHFGIRGIRERADARGGGARWRAAPSGGTRVEVELRATARPMRWGDEEVRG